MTNEELEIRFICAVCCGGTRLTPEKTQKAVEQVSGAMELMAFEEHPHSPFAIINLLHTQKGVEEAFKASGIAHAKNKAEAVCRVAGLWVADMLDLATASVRDLEAVRCVGPKTARYFVMTTRPNAEVVVLEPEHLRHLRENGVVNVPVGVPGKGALYERLESEFIKLARNAGATVRQYEDQMLATS